MAAHRRPRRRLGGGGTAARTAVTVTLAGAAGAAGLSGTGHADPQQTPAQVRAQVDKLYQEAEVATEKYNGAKEKADAAEQRLEDLRDEVARKEDRLNATRETLGSVAAAQYRGGGLDPALQLALSSDPDRYLEGAEFVQRVGSRQTAAVGRARKELRDVEQLRGAARIERAALVSRQAELKKHRKTVTDKLDAARRLLSGLTAEERAPRAATRSAGAREVLSASAEAPNSRAAAAVAYAYQKLGSPYVWGATGPNAFDCSGLTQAAYRSAGVALPRTTYAQIGAGRRVSRSELAPGDLVFFYSGISHVGIYVGNGQMIHAPNPSAPVRLAPVDEMPFAGAARVV
ncbi:C40 family peptidase [Streptomyces sp. SID5910]|uniref:NlpC/P60 family protein n=1 Tax=Streptomyces sp. SID5910 TaxID=2690312 RepID=UPI001371EA19|nr:NlpC/P60 family protein [Streptomyces sp. SID5910]